MKKFFKTKSHLQKTIWKRDYRNFSHARFRDDLSNIDWDPIYNPNTNVNDNFNHFFKEFEKTLDNHAPFKKIGKAKAKLFISPWVTKGLRKSITVRDKLHRKYSTCKNNDIKTLLRTNYNKYRNKITELLRKSKSNYYKIFFKEKKLSQDKRPKIKYKE